MTRSEYVERVLSVMKHVTGEEREAIRAEIIRRLFAFRMKTQEELKREKVAKITSEGGVSDGTVKREPVVKKNKVGRNDSCPCGSGKKYKNCCLDKDLGSKG